MLRYPMKPLIKRITPVVVLFIFLLFVLPKTYDINEKFETTEFLKGDIVVMRSCVVSINGCYKTSLFRQYDVFIGDIHIDTHSVTQGELVDIHFDPRENGFGSMSYQEHGEIHFFGYIYMDKKAKEIIICIFEPDANEVLIWDIDKGSYIIHPEMDQQNAAYRLY